MNSDSEGDSLRDLLKAVGLVAFMFLVVAVGLFLVVAIPHAVFGSLLEDTSAQDNSTVEGTDEVQRNVDEDAGVVCWTVDSRYNQRRGIDCLPIEETDLASSAAAQRAGGDGA